ncbi:CobW family GTP-binding protein [Desulfosporosinus youngiae]|uniref:Putative GTPase, G3E family n=1 Tax=Desulfosporosinus youngiae DSM 17734 TaxID=768710 RepID=H5Y440_9FIRM|nr:GTP-binding protein [Desulfosporosinus youngiae]EHQ89721.1 putative GTPase, G3E family [Desulfosporosinus youngiae DSM 17734]
MVKFDIISGFLGAGKTTLVKKILQSLDNKEKIVLIENDFGEVNVDREVLEIEGFEVYELSNGCVCCKLKGDFLLTLKQLLSQKIDRIIFEPSGIFILGEILDIFKYPEISGKCFINSVTTVVDAQNFSKHLQGYSGFFENQISYASSLVISKSQFLNHKEIRLIEKELRRINLTAPIIAKDWSELSGPDIKNLIDENPEECTMPDPKLFLSHNFDSIGLKTSRILDVEKVENILETCKNGGFGNVIRGKGILNSGDRFFEFNYVDGQYTISESTSSASGVVSFIGKKLAKDKLTAAFQ